MMTTETIEGVTVVTLRTGEDWWYQRVEIRVRTAAMWQRKPKRFAPGDTVACLAFVHGDGRPEQSTELPLLTADELKKIGHACLTTADAMLGPETEVEGT